MSVTLQHNCPKLISHQPQNGICWGKKDSEQGNYTKVDWRGGEPKKKKTKKRA